ncbi:4373_t:CDS:2 [Entrophospora sp. SA101]|nr:4373_t:CDS:2 [Entrophospora sp. SA101]
MIVLLDNKKKDLIYTKCYCEENIYHLCKEFLLDEKNEDYKEGIYVCFISNEDKVVPLFRQSSSELENGLVLWVNIMIRLSCNINIKRETKVNFFEKENKIAIIGEFKMSKYPRLIPGETFVKVFASDRSHMIDKDGMWNSPPPNYPPISNQEFTMNLDLFISMTENLNSDKFGKDHAFVGEVDDEMGNTPMYGKHMHCVDLFVNLIELHNPLRCEENMTKFKDFLNQIKYDGPILASTESIKLISKLHYHPKLECILSSILPLSEIKVSSFEDIDDIVNKD